MLTIGWIKRAAVDAAWIGDPAYEGVTDAAREEWRRSGGAASALAPFLKEGARPFRIRYRGLTPDEATHCQSVAAIYGQVHPLTGIEIGKVHAFRLGGEMPDLEPPPGVAVREDDAAGFSMLSLDVVSALQANHDQRKMMMFFGEILLHAALVGDREKKASSPPSTASPSSASTPADPPATTEPAAAATAATTS